MLLRLIVVLILAIVTALVSEYKLPYLVHRALFYTPNGTVFTNIGIVSNNTISTNSTSYLGTILVGAAGKIVSFGFNRTVEIIDCVKSRGVVRS